MSDTKTCEVCSKEYSPNVAQGERPGNTKWAVRSFCSRRCRQIQGSDNPFGREETKVMAIPRIRQVFESFEDVISWNPEEL